MSFLTVSGVSFGYGDRELLKGVNLQLNGGDRYALSGANGSGKTTFLRILSGELESHGGSISLSKGKRIGYLPQFVSFTSQDSLFEETAKGFDFLNGIADQLTKIDQQLGQTQDQDELLQLSEAQAHLQEILLSHGFFERESTMGTVLDGLGFSHNDYKKPVCSFSGGWQMRVALAKMLLDEPDVLLLDEPTNYLDLEAREWLQDWMKKYSGAILMVSHDRHFLDSTISGVAELHSGKVKLYKSSYSGYEKRRIQELEQLLKDYEQQQIEISKTEDFIRRFRYNASKAAMVQSRIKSLEKLTPIEIPDGLQRIHLSFPPAPRSGDMILRLEGLEKRYDELKIFNQLDLDIQRGEKIALVGKNGAGKSTLMRILSGHDTHYSGNLTWGTKVSTGYFAQETEQTLDDSLTLLESLEAKETSLDDKQIRSLLGAFLFRGDDVYKRISYLSGGEKNRLALVHILLEPINFLILDEPTNHLDLTSKDILLDALRQFTGTVLFVSHDVDFIQGLANRVIHVDYDPKDPRSWRRVTNYPGDYDYYLYQIAKQNQQTQISTSDNKIHHNSTLEKPSGSNEALVQQGSLTTQKQEREQEKQKKAQIRKLEKDEQSTLDKVHELEKAIEQIQHSLTKEEIYSDGQKTKALLQQQQSLEQNIELLMTQWEQLTSNIEALKS
jgi:ATP-binding cassette subfamily F protein 3